MAGKPKEETGTTEKPAGISPKVSFDTSNLKSSYANVCTMNCTREEVVLNFGLNQSWEHAANEVKIELNNRVILSPFAAKRMHEMLAKLLADYQGRYGSIQSGDGA